VVFAKAEAYIWYVEHFATRYDAGDRTFYDAIKVKAVPMKRVAFPARYSLLQGLD
jgi:hypothetical protein